MTMTRTFQSTRSDRQRPHNALDRFYHSFSAEFWLITASAIIIFDWCLHPSSSTTAFLMLASVSLGGFVCSTNPRISRTASDFLRKHGKSGGWMLFVGLLVGITVFNYATSPSSAMILTQSGVASLKAMVTGTAVSTAAGTAATSTGTAATGATAIIDNMIIVFRILFFTGFMWALYRAYDKYTQQAELLDVIQTPIVLLVVVGIIDAAALMFLGA
jgi:hypothetical protein